MKKIYMYTTSGASDSRLYAARNKAFVHNRGEHEAALVINRFSRKRNVTGNLVQGPRRLLLAQRHLLTKIISFSSLFVF